MTLHWHSSQIFNFDSVDDTSTETDLKSLSNNLESKRGFKNQLHGHFIFRYHFTHGDSRSTHPPSAAAAIAEYPIRSTINNSPLVQPRRRPSRSSWPSRVANHHGALRKPPLQAACRSTWNSSHSACPLVQVRAAMDAAKRQAVTRRNQRSATTCYSLYPALYPLSPIYNYRFLKNLTWFIENMCNICISK